ncbi:hypothetical protein THAOC_25814 [Thalassiosira oceanica]|uniref:Uncharacterized protein n=1 Tax=Thalassiosira oceanica TaxID=159749 RepID=K0RLE7_THAOC|nr:hypothetical protein THAOC_25814 [Thalassiosira oceanica]|eukprot:EJK54548.1 hypothetical protein THAOC_25814 [Thalassiosira oceanica]
MSCVPVVKHGDEVCANCGKIGSGIIKLKNCTACRLVKYCGNGSGTGGKEDPEAINALGDKYCYGQLGLQKDMRKAAELWTEAVELGSIDALFQLGIAYDTGKGVKQDKAKAVEFYEKAAMRGHRPLFFDIFEKRSGAFHCVLRGTSERRFGTASAEEETTTARERSASQFRSVIMPRSLSEGAEGASNDDVPSAGRSSSGRVRAPSLRALESRETAPMLADELASSRRRQPPPASADRFRRTDRAAQQSDEQQKQRKKALVAEKKKQKADAKAAKASTKRKRQQKSDEEKTVDRAAKLARDRERKMAARQKEKREHDLVYPPKKSTRISGQRSPARHSAPCLRLSPGPIDSTISRTSPNPIHAIIRFDT